MTTPKRKLRSTEWFGTADKNGFMYRSWMKNQGIPDHEFDGRPIIGAPRRTRVQARQVYVFCEAVALGWPEKENGGAAVARRGLDALIRDYRREDGLWVRALNDAGAVTDPTPDLYDLAKYIHTWTSWFCGALVGGHLLAALKHHLIDKDNILTSMLPRIKRRAQ